jgi:hypothetical protein
VGLNTAGVNAILDAGNEVTMFVAMGSGSGSGDQTSNERNSVTFTVANGVLTASNAPFAFTGTAAAGASNALLYSASSGGTFYGFDAVTGDQAFNAAGEYTLSTLTVTGAG